MEYTSLKFWKEIWAGNNRVAWQSLEEPQHYRMFRKFRSLQRRLEINTQRGRRKVGERGVTGARRRTFSKESELSIISNASKRSSNLRAGKVHLDLVVTVGKF